MLAFAFFAICLALGYIAREKAEQIDSFDLGLGASTVQEQAAKFVPATDIPVVQDQAVSDMPVVVDSAVDSAVEVVTEEQAQIITDQSLPGVSDGSVE
jgi:hypothetical protein